jgi:hypothetical protein
MPGACSISDTDKEIQADSETDKRERGKREKKKSGIWCYRTTRDLT